MATPEAILHYLAGLAPKRLAGADSAMEVIETPRDLVWLGDHPIVDDSERNPPPLGWYERGVGDRFERVVERVGEFVREDYSPGYTFPARMRHPDLERVVSIDALQPTDDRLRAGEMWLVGRRRVDGETVPVLLPLVSRSLRLHEIGGQHLFQPEWRRLPTLHPLLEEVITDEEQRLLERPIRINLARTLCERAGFGRPSVVPDGKSPLSVSSTITSEFRHEDEVFYLAPGTAVYLVTPERPTTVRAGIGRWMHEDVGSSAFAHLYGVGSAPEDGDEPEFEQPDVESPLPVNAKQRQAIVRSRGAVVSAIGGPPGTGKTHLVAAAAIDAIARGEAVLIATQSDHAAESVCELLDRYPSPPFVRFGRTEHRQQVAERLAAGRDAAPSDGVVDAARSREAAAAARRVELMDVIRGALEHELALERGLRDRPSLPVLTAAAPGVLAESVDLDRARQLLARARDRTGVLGGWRAGRAETRLRALTAARPGAELDGIERAIAAAEAERAVESSLIAGGVTLDPLWDQLAEADDVWREALAAWVDVRRRHEGRRRRARTSLAALANVMRVGVGRRTELLSTIESDDFLDLLPLWVGTLNEIERTLPVMPELFDLVILDEASPIDQLNAVGALCRARRAIVVGDPQQLRHVSFVSDDDMDREFSRCLPDETPTLRRILDQRRNSLFDVAAGASEVVWLDEHFRSVPHLIGFSATRFYDDELRLMTQHPSVEGVDAIEQVRVEGDRIDGVNIAEVAAIKDLVADLAYRPETGTIGVVTPFRKQADALVEMMLDRFDLTQIRQFGLRAGTVHSFQGTERDTMVVSLGLGPDDLSQSLRFVEDRHLFNVMVTRARRRLVLVHSFDPAALRPGLLSDYFRFADNPPHFVERRKDAAPWTREIADAIGPAAGRVITDYPVAGWTIDIALGQGESAFGVECTVHAEGPDAHIERHLTLRRAGWTLTDAFQSRWMIEPEQAGVHLAVELQRRAADAAAERR